MPLALYRWDFSAHRWEQFLAHPCIMSGVNERLQKAQCRVRGILVPRLSLEIVRLAQRLEQKRRRRNSRRFVMNNAPHAEQGT